MRLVLYLPGEDRLPIFGFHPHPLEGGGAPVAQLASDHYAVVLPRALIAHHAVIFVMAPHSTQMLGEEDLLRYCQMLWIGFSSHAATFSSIPSTSFPFLNFAPALTNATR